MRAPFLPKPDDKTLVHTTDDCKKRRKECFCQGFFVGMILALCLALGLGIGAARWQEGSFDREMRLVQAQHRAEIETERKRVARYAEIDALATEMDRVAAMGEGRWTYRDRERGE